MTVDTRPTSGMVVAHLLNQMYQVGSIDEAKTLLHLMPSSEADRAELVGIASSSAKQMFGPKRGEQIQTWFQGGSS